MSPVFEDDALVVFDKPAGMPTQATRSGGDNLFDAARASRPYVGLHHRLDTAASGLVLFTVDPGVNAAIADAFRAHTIDRRYRAVLDGWVESGVWERDIDGKSARTDVVVVGQGGGRTAVELALATGRRHQVRVHAAFAGAPVLGDHVYGERPTFPRLALHAYRLGLIHPRTGAPVAWEAPLPEPLLREWEALTRRR